MRELKEEERPVLVLQYKHTSLNEADCLNKNLTRAIFERHAKHFVGHDEYMLPQEQACCSLPSLSSIEPRSESKKEEAIRKQVKFDNLAEDISAQTTFEEDDGGPVKDSPAEESR